MATSTVQQMFVGGSWQPSASGETFEATSPATGEMIGTVPAGRPRRRRPRDRRRARRRRRLGAADRVRARGEDARRRRLIESRRDELARTLTLDQGKPLRAEALRRGRRAGRVLADGGRGRQAPRRRAAQLVLARQARDADAPPARRGRRDQPVELALHDAGRADRAGARLRQRGRVDAGAVDGRVRGRARRVHRRRRPAAGRVQPRHRARGRWSATRSPATRAPTASRSSARPRPAGSSRRRPRARRRCSRWAATDRWW